MVFLSTISGALEDLEETNPGITLHSPPTVSMNITTDDIIWFDILQYWNFW